MGSEGASMRNLELQGIAAAALRRICIFSLLLAAAECAVIVLVSVLCQVLAALGHASAVLHDYFSDIPDSVFSFFLQVPGMLAGGVIVGLLNPRRRWSVA